MATAEDCRLALETLTSRISELDAQERAKKVLDRTMSVRVPDLGVTFVTRVGPDGAEPVRQAANGARPAQVRFTADSDVVVAIAADPASFMKAWLSGRLKVQGNVLDLLHLRKLL
jgi:predicted lipid carrier protein YhbT